MANRYWVGGTAAWDATAGTKWALTSGGAGGQTVPTAADDVFFTAASGAVTCTVTGSRTCLSLNCTGFTGTLTGTSTPVLTISGNMTLVAGMTFVTNGGPSLIFNSTTTGRTITSGGKNPRTITFNGVGGAWSLQDNLTVNNGGLTVGSVTLTNGTLDLNNFTLDLPQFLSNNSNTRTLAFGTGSIAFTGSVGANFTAWSAATITGLTVTGTPNVISQNSAGFNYTLSFLHGSTAGNTEARAINFTTVGTSANIDFALTGAFKNVNLSTCASSSSLTGTARTIYGNLTLSATQVLTQTASVTTFAATSGTQDITSAGKQLPFPVTQSGVGGTVRLLDAFSCASSYTLNNGVFNANNFNVTATKFISNNSNIRTITMGSGLWTLTGSGTSTNAVWNIFPITNLTFNKNTADILFLRTDTGARDFYGGGLTYNKFTIGGTTGTSTCSIYGANTFSEIASTKTVAHTLLFAQNVTTTVAAFTVTGTAGNVVTIGSTSGSNQFTLTKTGGGTINVDYASISDSAATPTNTWYAGVNSTDAGNNTGWIFANSTAGKFLLLF